MVQKRKAVTKLTQGATAGKHLPEVSEEEVEEDMEVEEEQEVSEETKQEEDAAARVKELKAIAVEDLKKLVDSLGLERGKKTDMIEDVLKHEEEVRKQKRERAENVRMIVVRKKEELTSLPAADLKERCLASAIMGNLPKQERVEHLLTNWQEHGGIDKALAQNKHDKRESELAAMQSKALRQLCDKAGMDVLVKEVMVDRLIRKEIELGKFDPPALAKPEEKAPDPKNKPDMIAMFLANEAVRAKQKAEEEKEKERAALIAKKKETLKSITLPELKQRLSAKGLRTSGSKDELVEALFAREVQDEALAAKKADLKALGKDNLKELLATKGLEAGGVNEMIETLLKHEVQCAKDLKEYEVKITDQLKLKKKELEAKTGNELKEMCTNKSLPTGSSNEDRVQRLLRDAKECGEIDRAISLAARAARREVLEGLDKPALKKLCEELRVDPFVTAVLVERLLFHEAEAGLFAKDDSEAAQPVSKKCRTGSR